MKLLKCLFAFGILATSLSACEAKESNYNGSNNTPVVKYLTLGETARTGKLSQTIKRLDYIPSPYGLSENEKAFELEFTLHSDYESIVALSNIYSYSAVFDGNRNNGGTSLSGNYVTPSSIAPNKNETVLLRLTCFADWRTVVVSYKDQNNNAYSFSLRSSDYPDYTNNTYPLLKQNDSFTTEDGKAEVKFTSLKTTIISSAYAGPDEDNLEFVISLTSHSNENLSIPSWTNGYSIKCDAGFSKASFSVGSPNPPSTLPANDTIDLKFIIVLSKEWKTMVFGCDGGIVYKFSVHHSDVSY